MPNLSRRLQIETLEDRSLPANLQITNLVLVDGNNNPISATPLGETIVLRAEWAASGMTNGQQYIVRFTVNGVDYDSGTVTHNGNGGGYWWWRFTSFAKAGTNTVSAKVDGANQITETDESDADNRRTLTFTADTITGPPTKWLFPVSAKPVKTVWTNNYADVDPRSGFAADYTGGPFQYDGHDAHDIGPANFGYQDAGVPLIAVAPGVVSEVIDGYFDRETSMNSNQGNYVKIDHQNGWQTLYYHMAANSIVVKTGDTVTAGQLLGLMGSSGSSTGTHIHFTSFRNNAAIEPMYDASKYFIDPPPYQGSAEPEVVASGITNYDIWSGGSVPDGSEMPSALNLFPTSTSDRVYSWYSISNFPTGSAVAVKYYRPNGSFAFQSNFTPNSTRAGNYYWWASMGNFSSTPGTWEVVFTINDVEKARNFFTVTTGAGLPEIRVTNGTRAVIDERTTPMDFGTVASGATAPTQTYRIHNHGHATLTTSNLVLPTGFSLVGSFPTSIAANAFADFTVRMDTAVVGSKFGVLRFDTNDADEAVYNFLLKGTVTGSPISGSPTITLPGPAALGVFGDIPRYLDSTATFSDSDTANYNTGTLRYEIIQGGSANDRLAIFNEGTGAGQIGVNGSTVSFSGTPIGTFTGGIGSSPLEFAFNTGSTPSAIQALMRRITYQNVATTYDARPRFIRITSTDPTSKISNVGVKRVSLAMDAVNDAPVSNASPATMTPVLEDTTSPAGQLVGAFAATGATDADSIDPFGIALTGYSNAEGGTWHYSVNGGATWKTFGTVSDSAALLLRATDWVRFTPTPNANGIATLTYRPWDQSTGVYGAKVNLTGTGATGGKTAYSATTQTANLTITPINDIPSFTKGNDHSTTEDAGPQTITNWATGISAGPSNESSQVVSFEVTNNTNPSLFSAGPAVDSSGKLTYTPADNAYGSATITLRAVDNGGTDHGGVNTSATQSFTITVQSVPDAPTLDNTGTMVLDPIDENVANNAGTLILDIIASAGGNRITDPDAGAVEGLAIIAADTAHGTWQYSTNNGTSWLALGSVSPTNARLLAADSQTRVRFQSTANFNGTVDPALTFRAWDQTSGSNGGVADTSSNGGTTAFSSATETASIVVTPNNSAPVLDHTGSMQLNSLAEDSTNDVGTLITSLIASAGGDRITDNDSGALEGIAIIAAETAHGVWEYTVNGGTSWQALGAVSATSGRLLAANTLTRLRFSPNADFNDTIDPAITFRAWDQTTGTNGGLADPSFNGTFTAFSIATETASITVTPVNDAPVLDNTGLMFLNDVAEDDSSNLGTPIPDLLASAGGDRITDIDASASEGIAITNADTTFGTWEWSIDDGASWTALGIVNASNARLLASNLQTRLRFLPSANVHGSLSNAITFHAWDQSSGSNGGSANPTVNGGTTAFSSVTESAAITITPVNDAPLLDNAGIFELSSIAEDDLANQGNLITELIASAGGDRVTDIDVAPVEGIAVIDTDRSHGTWEYSLTNGSTWLPVGDVTATNARQLAADTQTRIRFVPAADFNGLLTTALTFRAWDQTTGTNGALADASTTGGATAFSSVTATTRLNVTALNDPPRFSKGNDVDVLEDAGLQTITNWATNINAGASDEGAQDLQFHVSIDNPALFTTAPAIASDGTLTFTPAADLHGTATVTVYLQDDAGGLDTSPTQTFAITVLPQNDAPIMTGPDSLELAPIPRNITTHAGYSVATILAGVTLEDIDGPEVRGLALTSTSGPGAWSYSLDNGATWLPLTNATTTDALLLSDTARVRFLPTPNATGLASFQFHAWDQTTGNSGTRANLAQGTGGTSAFSLTTRTALLHVITTLSPVAEDTKKPKGNRIGDVIAGTTNDTDFNAKKGIALIGLTGTTDGLWQYSLNKGRTWKTITGVAPNQALLLRDTDQLRFLPNTNFHGTAYFTYHAWDQTTSNAATKVDLTTTGAIGGATPFSQHSAQGMVTVNPVNDAPVLDTGKVVPFAPVLPNTQEPTGTLVRTLLGSNSTDIDGDTVGMAVIGVTGKGIWQYRRVDDTGWQPLGKPSSRMVRLLSPTDQLRFIPDADYVGQAILRYKAWDGTNGQGGTTINPGRSSAFSKAIATAKLLVTNDSAPPPNHAPVLDNSGSPTLPNILEDTKKPSSTTVASLLGNTVTDADSGALQGIAITGYNSTIGAWQYSRNGRIWVSIKHATDAQAILLSPTDRLRFLPQVNQHGTATLTYHAWDQTHGTAGAVANLASGTGQTTPFSIASETLTVTVTPSNDAPTLDPKRTPLLTPVAPTDSDPTGTTVASLLDGANDVDGDVIGIAVTAATGPGVWQYRSDASGPWTDMPTPSAQQPFLLAASAVVRLVPSGTGTARFVFQAHDGQVASRLRKTLTLGVNTTEQAPLIPSGWKVNLTPINKDNHDSAGDLIAHLLSTATDPDPNAVLGIAITGAATTNGEWEIASNGLDWEKLGSVSMKTPKLLQPTQYIRFVPKLGYTGSASFTYRVWDTSTVHPTSPLAFSKNLATATIMVNTAPEIVE